MAIWKMRSGDGVAEIYVNAVVDGLITGMVEFGGKSYTVNGQWASAGKARGRDFSGFTFSGSDGRSAPEFIAAAGTISGAESAPEVIVMSVIQTNSINGRLQTWEGDLRPEYV